MKMETNIVYQEDCIEGMKKLPKESVDLIVADPPYYKTINEEWDKQWKTEEEFIEWCRSWFKECVRVLKPTGSFYCYGFFDILSKLKVLVFDKELYFRQNITLNKGVKSIAGRTSDKLRMFPTASEYLLFYVNVNLGGNTFFSDNILFKPIIEYLRKEFEEARKIGYKTKQFRELMGLNIEAGGIRYFAEKVWIFPTEEHYNAFQKTGRFKIPYSELLLWYNKIKESVYSPFNLPFGVTDVWDFNIDKNRFHPTQKPKQITDRIIEASSNKNQIVLIPFGGSGSEVLSCMRNFRQFICYENNPQYFKIIKDRIKSAKSQTLLSQPSAEGSLIGIKRKPCEVSQIPNGTSLNSDIMFKMATM